MKKLLNTLFVTKEDAYLSLDGENVLVSQNKAVIGRFPLHILESIFTFSYAGASPALMGKCVESGINLVFLTPRGRFLCRADGIQSGNVLLRRTQYRIADVENGSVLIARNMIVGKIYNQLHSISRTMRDHAERVDQSAFTDVIGGLNAQIEIARTCSNFEQLRGCEGVAARLYFSVFDQMILRNKEDFFFDGRSRRPPMNNVNALLSFVYSLLANDCVSGLESVGLDSYVGFMHTDKPGRRSLSLDLMEELRPCFADRFVLTLINNRIVSAKDFEKQESGAVFLSEDGRKKIQREWHERKQEEITHPYLKEKVKWGLVPYVQSLLLARYLRNDLNGYPPFMWK